MEDKKEKRRGGEMRGGKRMGKEGGGRVEGMGGKWKEVARASEGMSPGRNEGGRQGMGVVDEIQKLFLPRLP
jgi:hypothetical protein